MLLASSWKNPLILFQCYEVHLTYDNQVSRRRRQSAVVMIIQSVTQNQVESCRQRRKLNFSYNTTLHSVEKFVKEKNSKCCWYCFAPGPFKIPSTVLRGIWWYRNQVESCRQWRKLNFSYNTTLHSVEKYVKKIPYKSAER